MRLSKDFTLAEFTFSETAVRLGREVMPPRHIITNLETLCLEILQPLRDYIGVPLIITSGYRPEWLNKIVGGSRNSSHMFGRAADVRTIGLSPYELCKKVVELGLSYDQLILEFKRWMHVSIGDDIPMRQVLTAKMVNGKVTYTPGLYND